MLNKFSNKDSREYDDLSVEEVYGMNSSNFYEEDDDFYKKENWKDLDSETKNDNNFFSDDFDISDDNCYSQENKSEGLKTKVDDIKTPVKRPFLKKGEGKSLVISNSRKENSKNSKNSKDLEFINKIDNSIKSSNKKLVSTIIKDNNEDEFLEKDLIKNNYVNYDEIIQQKLNLLDEKMEYIHQTHQEVIRNKNILNKERKQLESYKNLLEKELKSKYEKSKTEFEIEKKRLERENIKLTKEKMKSNELITHLKMTLKAKDAEIARLIKEISQKEKKEKDMENKLNKLKNEKNDNLKRKNETRKLERSLKNKSDSMNSLNNNIAPVTTLLQTTSISSNSSSSFIDKDFLIEEFLLNFDFEKELDLLYGILSTSFAFSDDCDDFTTLPKVPNDLNVPWCDIEKPYKTIKDDDLKTITFKFPSGLIEIVFIDESNNSICPINTRKLLWMHLGWCIIVYPNNDIKAIKPNKNIIYHYIEKDIVKCIVNIKDILSCDGEETRIHLSKFFSLNQLQCVDPETKKTYIIHSDKTKQIINNSVN